jgi:hypothetical protein
MNLQRILCSLLLFWPAFLTAQRFGGNPTRLHWRQTGSDTVRVIFPTGSDLIARRVSGISHFLAQINPFPLGKDIKGINILLQSGPVISNAYVGLAPRRSEFFLTPMQNSLRLGALSWVDMLTLHEYRHVQQYTHFNRGISKIASWVAGEQGQALANAMAIPDWFFEGDAVDLETVLSGQGRGRLPDFFNGYRSIWLSNRNYSYLKLRNGSLKDYVPDHYQLGYLLIRAGREKFGPEIWSKVTTDAAAFKPLVYPFQGAFRRHTGVSFRTFSTDVFRNRIGLASTPADQTSVSWLSGTHRRTVRDDEFPAMIGQDSMLVVSRGYDLIPGWYLMDKAGREQLAVKDIGIDDYYTYGGGRLAYTAYRPHPRWSWQEYSDIMVLNISDGKRKRITENGRYFSPDISSDGSRVAAVHADGLGRSRLRVLDATDGRLIREFSNEEDYFHTYPVFGQHPDEVISAVRNPCGQMALISWDLRDSTHRILVPFSEKPIAFPNVHGSFLTFTAPFEGFDRLFLFDLRNGKLYRPEGLPSAINGAVYEDASGSLSFSAFTADGMRIGRDTLENLGRSISAEDWVTSGLPAVLPTASANLPGILNDSLTENDRAITPRSILHRPLNIHSWRLGFEQPEWSFELYGENVPNTIRSSLYYRYNINEGFHKMGADALVSVLYPWIRSGFSVTRDRYFRFPEQSSTPGQTLRWDEWTFYTGLSLPLNLTGGRHFRYLNVSTGYNFQGIAYRESSTVKPDDRRIQYLGTSVSWSMQTQMARQHIFPRWAHSIYLSQRTGISGLAANQFLGMASLYLPGITRRQSLVLNGAWQRRDTLRQYIFSNAFPLSRGYPGVDYPHMWKAGVNYHFTLAYPDMGIGHMAYLLRVRANLFYDHSWLKSLRQQRVWALRSIGAELHLDTKWWNQLPVSFGFRYSRLLDTDIYVTKPSLNRWEFIIPVDLVPGGVGGRQKSHLF